MNKRRKIAHKMTVLLASLCLCLTLVGGLALYNAYKNQQRLNIVYQDRVIPLKMLKIVSDAYAVDLVDTAHKVRDGEFTAEQGLQSLKNAQRDIKTNWTAFLDADVVGEEARLAKEFIRLQQGANRTLADLEAILQSGDLAALKEFTTHQLYQSIDPLQNILGQLITFQLEQTNVVYEESVLWSFRARVAVVTMILLSGLVALIAGYTITQSITGSLGGEPDAAVSVARRVAKGNLTVPVELQPGSSPTSLIAQLKEMQESLERIVGNVNLGAGEVATASKQIAEGNSDLASRTQQQAKSLEDTSAAMEELTATVSQNAQSATQVSEMARNAMSVAQTGGNMMQEVIVTMRDIDESSRQISSITALIDDIASQTNLLSLNAAVEAARAGEQGRGFTVVAGEVRSLAQRSADAARQIKSLIDSSMGRVQKGSELVVGAGETMDQLVSEVKRVSMLIDEISIACREQSQGVEQVGIAVTHMDEARQQNAALVEEISSAANSLNNQAQRLVQTMSAFQLPANT